jgi:hypothetical protein
MYFTLISFLYPDFQTHQCCFSKGRHAHISYIFKISQLWRNKNRGGENISKNSYKSLSLVGPDISLATDEQTNGFAEIHVVRVK